MNDDFSQEKVDVRSRIELEIKATYVRELAMEMIAAAGSGHPGGSLSIADVITAIYFGEINGVPILNIDPKNPRAASRDRVVLSKGHAAPILYAALNLKGFFSEEHNSTLRELNSPLQGHPDMNKLAGIDMSSGELGLGLSTAGGIAHASRILEKPYAVYAILGDGEMQKGQVWEALMAIPNKRLNNICLIVDRNKLQIDGTVEEVNDIGRVEDKLKEFGWNPMGIDGHSFHEILKAINTFKNIQEGQPPVAIVAHTRKGAGVVAMSGDYTYHGKAPRPKVLNNAKEAFELKREDSRKRLAKLTKHEDEPARIQKPLEIKNGHDNIESLESIIKRKPVRDYVRSTATRRAFGYALHRLGSYEPIVVLNADLIESTKTFDFVENYPQRSIQMGIQEQNMLGWAAGLASCGLIPITNSFAIFSTLTPASVIRQNIAYTNLNVKIVGSHAGAMTGPDGGSHQAIEDMGIIRAIPNIVIIEPSDAYSTEKLFEAALAYNGPVYFRTGRCDVPLIYSKDNEFGLSESWREFEIGKGHMLVGGTDVAIIASGVEVSHALKASQESDYSVMVIDMPTINPIDKTLIEAIVNENNIKGIIVAQDHYMKGALGDEVSDILTGSHNINRYVPLERIGLNGFGQSGKPSELMEHYKLSSKYIGEAVDCVMKRI